MRKEKMWVRNRSNREGLSEVEVEYGTKGALGKQVCIEEMDVVILGMKGKEGENGLSSVK